MRGCENRRLEDFINKKKYEKKKEKKKNLLIFLFMLILLTCMIDMLDTLSALHSNNMSMQMLKSWIINILIDKKLSIKSFHHFQ